MAVKLERPIPNRRNEIAATHRSKVVTRPMTRDEYRKYFGIEPPARKAGKRA